MIALGHTSIGTIVGVTTISLWPSDWPILLGLICAGLFGLISHYAMDLVPHGHYHFNGAQPTLRQWASLFLDFTLPIILLTLYLGSSHGWHYGSTLWFVGAAVLGAHLPDLLMMARTKNLLPSWSFLAQEAHFHASTHWHNPQNPARATPEGGLPLALPRDLWQLAALILAMYLLTK